MPLVEAKCTNCGAVLQVDDSLDAAICPYCNTAYIVEKAINNYTITNNITNNITAGVVNIINKTSDFEIETGVLKKYRGAETDVVLPNTVKVIKRSAFSGNQYLTSVKIPDGVTVIEDSAFAGCLSLRSINIPYGITVIREQTFKDCSSLTSISIPDIVDDIEWFAFAGCSNLSNIVGAERFYPECFDGTAWFENYDHLHREYRSKNLCQHCGGKFIGVFTKMCSKCGRPKDY